MLLEKAYPGILKQANLYLMGGYVFDIPTGYPHEPLACAIALGWREGVEIETVPLTYETREGWLYEIPDPDGTPTRLVTKIDGRAFDEFWYEMLCR